MASSKIRSMRFYDDWKKKRFVVVLIIKKLSEGGVTWFIPQESSFKTINSDYFRYWSEYLPGFFQSKFASQVIFDDWF